MTAINYLTFGDNIQLIFAHLTISHPSLSSLIWQKRAHDVAIAGNLEYTFGGKKRCIGRQVISNKGIIEPKLPPAF